MKVEITARCEVQYSKIVEMSDLDYAQYLDLVNTERSSMKVDRQLERVAERYGLRDAQYAADYGDLEEIMFEPVQP